MYTWSTSSSIIKCDFQNPMVNNIFKADAGVCAFSSLSLLIHEFFTYSGSEGPRRTKFWRQRRSYIHDRCERNINQKTKRSLYFRLFSRRTLEYTVIGKIVHVVVRDERRNIKKRWNLWTVRAKVEKNLTLYTFFGRFETAKPFRIVFRTFLFFSYIRMYKSHASFRLLSCRSRKVV